MKENTTQCRFYVKFSAYRVENRVDSVSADIVYPPVENTNQDQRVVVFDLEIPNSLFDPPVLRGKVRSQMQDLFDDFIEGLEIENAN